MVLSETILARLRDAAGPNGWLENPREIEPYTLEQRGYYRGACDFVARPASTEAVAAVVSICAQEGISITPQSGNTGLMGGGVPDGGIVLSLSRLNRIREIDRMNYTMTVEAGCILADIQNAAKDADCLFPLSLGAEGSCQIGGNLSTNAGGVNVLRYGNARDLALGLEVVLPDGRIWNGLRGLRKDNTGYDLKQLFVGAEGTLGIITAAVLKLFPYPKSKETAMAAAGSLQDILTLFVRIRDCFGEALTAFEFMPKVAIDLVTRHIPDTTDPFDEPYPYYALIELSSARNDETLRDALETALGAALEDGRIANAVVASSEAQTAGLWRLRETIPEAEKKEGASIKHDVAVPVSRIAEFLERAGAIALSVVPDLRLVTFGHLGDGNIHFNLSQPVGAQAEEYLAHRHEISRKVLDLVVSLGGSFSAEHGIGRQKLKELNLYKADVERDLMHSLKRTLDPAGIMNPGKVVNVEK
ncbi:MAG: FAD-binding oxidoreductase [Rhodospirillales bacterium]